LRWLASRHIDLSVMGQNLLSAKHLEYAVSSPNPREEIQRGVFAKLAIRW
jgi:hypothetical protein